MPDTSTEVAIATTTLGSAASSITFSSIPGTYTDLRLVVVGAPSNTGSGNWFNYTFNSSVTGYSSTSLSGNGAAASSSRVTSDSSLGISASRTANSMFMVTIDVFSYAGSTNKTSLTTWSGDLNGSGNVVYQVGLWANTSAITSMLLSASSGNFNIGTTATLYGIL